MRIVVMHNDDGGGDDARGQRKKKKLSSFSLSPFNEPTNRRMNDSAEFKKKKKNYTTHRMLSICNAK